MRKFLRTTKALLVAAGLCVGASAWADETTTVGADDNSADFFSAWSDYYTLEPNQTLTLNFKNYSSKGANWNNWIAAVTTDAVRWGDGYSEYIILRADNAGWGTRWVASNLSSNYNWDTFKDDMDGSSVTMTVTRNGALVTVHADITTSDASKTYYENFYTACGTGTQNIRVFLSVDHSHITDITSNIAANGNTSDSENWGVENAFIDFTNDITGGTSSKSVAGETNSIALGTAGRWGKGYTYTDAEENSVTVLGDVIRIGSVDGTITIPDGQIAGSKDEVVVTFDIWFGKLSGKSAYFELYDNSATPSKFAGFKRDFFSGTTSENTFRLDESKITSIGSSGIENNAICVDDNKTTFNIHLNYLTGKMYVVQYTNGGWQQTTSEIEIGTTYPLKKLVFGSGYNTDSRRCWLDNVFIYTKKGDYNTTANITLSFKDDLGNDISALYTGTSAFTPEKGETFDPADYYPAVMYDDNYKYTYSSGGSSFTVTGDRDVELTYTRSARPTYTYNVTANYGAKNKKIIDAVSVKEAADYTYYYPRFILDGTTLYEYASSTDANAAASYWTSTHNSVAADGTYTLTYNAVSGECVYYTEGEDVTGALEYTYFKQYMSGGSSAVLESATTLTTLDAGIYKVTIRSLGKTTDRHAYLYKDSESEENLIIDKTVSSNSGTDDSVVFSLDASTNILAKGGYNTPTQNGAGIDYVYIMKLPSSVSVTVTDAGMATYVNSDYDLDFSATGIKAYKAKVTAKSVCKLTEVANVPAGTPVLLVKEEGATENIPVMTGAVVVSDNDLVAGTGAAVATDGGTVGEVAYTNMILNKVDGNVGFYFANGKTVATNRAYLHIASSLAPDAEGGEARRMVMVFDGEATGISTVQGEGIKANGYYNLNGQRVAAPQKGLYIVNGKKVLVK